MKKIIYSFAILASIAINSNVKAQSDCSSSYEVPEIQNAGIFGKFQPPGAPTPQHSRLAIDFDLAADVAMIIDGFSPSLAFNPSVNPDNLTYAIILHENTASNTVGTFIDTIYIQLDSTTFKGDWFPESSSDTIPFSYYHFSPISNYTIAPASNNRKFWVEFFMNPPTSDNAFCFWESAASNTPALEGLNFSNNGSPWASNANGDQIDELVYQLRGTCSGGSSSIEELENNSVKIYPNPTSGITQVELENTEFEKITVFNSLGTLVLESKNNTIDLSNFNSGIYYLEVTTNSGQKLLNKLIKK